MSGTKGLLGIVGGLGPLASAEFLKTIYEHSLEEREQETPRVVLYSDPTFPDRTEACLNGGEKELLDRLVHALTGLQNIGASQFIICCITIHHLLPRVPLDLRSRIVSLLDVIFEAVAASHEPHLLMCTIGTRELRTFERHVQWQRTRDLFVLPDDVDQREIHRLIYRLKQNLNVREEGLFIESLLRRYEINSFIAGCTDLHLLAKHVGVRCIDPLTDIAKQLAHSEALAAAGATT